MIASPLPWWRAERRRHKASDHTPHHYECDVSPTLSGPSQPLLRVNPGPHPRLNPAPPASKPWGNRRITMLALGIIFGFIAVMALMNLVEFGRVD